MSRLTFLILAFVLPLVARPALADDIACTSRNLSRWTKALRLAQARADFGSIETTRGKLAVCAREDLEFSCDGQCLVDLVEFDYFYYASIPLLRQRGNPIELERLSQGLASAIERASFAIENSWRRIAAPSDGGNALKRFLELQGRLKALKAKLLMSKGDAYYVAVRDPLGQVLRIRLDAGSAEPRSRDSYLGAALEAYRDALGVVLDATADMVAGVDPNLRADVERTKSKLEERIASIEEGRLFVGIDPFDPSPRGFEAIQNDFDVARAKVAAIEGDIQARIAAAGNASANRAAQEDNDAKWKKERELDLKVHDLETMGAEKSALERAMGALDDRVAQARQTALDRQQQLELEHDLQRQAAQIASQTEDLDFQRRLDVLEADTEATSDKRDVVRFQMERAQVDTQIDLQQQGFEQAASESAARAVELGKQLLQAENQIESQRRAKSAREREIEAFAAQIAGIDTRVLGRNAELQQFLTQRREHASQQMELFAQRSDLRHKTCALQTDLASRDYTYFQTVYACHQGGGGGGGDCPYAGDGTMRELLNGMWTEEVGAAQEAVDSARGVLAEARSRFEQWHRTAEQVRTTAASIMDLVRSAGAVYQAVSKIPKTLVAGLSSGVEIDPSVMAKSVFDTLMEQAEAGLTTIESEEQLVRILNDNLAKMADMGRALRADEAFATTAKFRFKQRLLELDLTKVQQERELNRARLQKQLVALECQNGDFDAEARKDELEARVDEIAFEEARRVRDNAVDASERTALEARIARERLEIERVELEIARLDIEKTILVDRKRVAEHGVAAAEHQRATLDALRHRLDGMASEEQRLGLALEELRGRRVELSDDAWNAKKAALATGLDAANREFVALSDNLRQAAATEGALRAEVLPLVERLNTLNQRMAAQAAEVRDSLTASSRGPNGASAVFEMIDLDLEGFATPFERLADRKMQLLLDLHALSWEYATKLSFALPRSSREAPVFAFQALQMDEQFDDLERRFDGARLADDAIRPLKFVLGPDAPLVRRLNARGEATFGIADLRDAGDGFTFAHRILGTLRNKRVLDVKFGWELTDCREPDASSYLKLTHLGVNEFDAPGSENGAHEKIAFVTPAVANDATPLPLARADDLERSLVGRSLSVADLWNGHVDGFDRPLGTTWFGRSVQGLWRLSLPFDPGARRHLKPECEGEARDLSKLAIYVYYVGEPY